MLHLPQGICRQSTQEGDLYPSRPRHINLARPLAEQAQRFIILPLNVGAARVCGCDYRSCSCSILVGGEPGVVSLYVSKTHRSQCILNGQD
jgi:hypothetical protein